MAKYRGRYQGKTRGRYVQAEFQNAYCSGDEANKNFRSINDFLSKKGQNVSNSVVWNKDPENRYTHITSVYHLAGASVALRCETRFSETSEMHPPRQYVSLRIVSNESIEKIVEFIERGGVSIGKRAVTSRF